MEYVEKKTESNERLSLQLQRKITEVEKLGDDTSALWKQLGELQEYVNISREDLKSFRMYSFVSLNTHLIHNVKNDQKKFLIILFIVVAIFQSLNILICLCLGCILKNHTRGLKISQHKLDAVLLHLRLTG